MPVALVTGASSGLGVEFARQLADRGHDLILVARRRERMEELAAELPTSCHVIDHDLAADAPGLLPRVAELGVDVDLLVNNAGFGTYGRFLDQDPAREAEEVRLNCEAVVTLTHAFLPQMVERGEGGVIVVASTAGFNPIPYEATYSATKAFARFFTEALSEEIRGTGVRCLCVNPGPVPTEWQEVSGLVDGTERIPGTISAEQCVRESLKAYDSGDRSVVPGAVIRWLTRLQPPGPRGIQLRVTERIFRPRD